MIPEAMALATMALAKPWHLASEQLAKEYRGRPSKLNAHGALFDHGDTGMHVFHIEKLH
jgi:hypothetical protein